ncbi:MAG: hypothetical protein LC127_07545 [Chitinophagales bacterium]|nr:hypothetical protein [Chitinophagales bacterium]
MSEQDINSSQDGTNLEITDEEIDALLEEDKEEDSNELDPAKVQAELQRKDQIIRQLTARAKTAEAKAQPVDKQIIKPAERKDDGIKQTVERLALAEEKRQFGYENNLSPEETDYIFKINSKPSKELLDDPFIKGGIDAIRAKKKVESNTPALNSRSPRFELPRKKDMTPDDKQKHFEDYMSNLKRK